MSKKLDKALWEYSQELNKGVRPDLTIYQKKLDEGEYREFLDLAQFVALSKLLKAKDINKDIERLIKLNRKINIKKEKPNE